MPVRFESIDQYYTDGALLDIKSVRLNGLLLTGMEEPSNEIRVASTRMNSVLWSRSGSDHHCFGVAGHEQFGPTAPGSVALQPADAELSSAWETKGYNLQTLAVEFDASLFKAFAPEICSDRFLDGHIQPSGYAPRPALAALLGLLEREMDPDRAMGALFSDAVTRLLTLEIAASVWSLPVQLPRLGNRRDPRIGRALAFIEAHFLENISLLDIATAAGFSVAMLITRFQSEIGQTPYAYVIEQRVCHALRLLQGTDMPIAQVASESGFSDQQHLTRVIRSRRFTTPKAIRQGTRK